MFRSRLPLPLSIAAVLALIVGLLATTVLFVGLRRLEHQKVDLDFRRRAQAHTVAVQQQLDEAVQVLKELNQLFITFEPVTRDQFHLFIQPLRDRHPYVQAFNFHRIVPEQGRHAYENDMRMRFADFSITELANGKRVPVQQRNDHLVVDYLEPMQGNEAAFGLDVTPNRILGEAVQHATDSGQATSTSLLTLAQGGGKQRGFLVVMPVYRHGAPLADVAARRRAVIGDTAAVFDAGKLFNKILRANGLLDNSGIDISVYAGDRIDERNLAYRAGSVQRKPVQDSLLPDWLFYDQPDAIVHAFDVAGKPWRMVVDAPPVAFTVNHGDSLAGAIAGIVISVLLAAYLQALALRSKRIQRLVEQRTIELRDANAMLIADIAARKRTEEALQLRQRAIEASANAVIITNAQPPLYPIEYVNPAFERITGYSAADVIGRSSSLLWADDSDQPEIREIQVAVREKREANVTLRGYAKDGSLIWCDVYIAPVRDEGGEVNHFVVAIYDISATKHYQAELEFQANRDTLTGLANRNLLRDRLTQACVYAERYAHSVWVLFLNLDRFKFVNDTLGHKAGDQLLKSVAQRLQAAVRDTDTAARLSADEFVLVLPGRTSLAPAPVQQIMDAVAQPIVIDGHEFVIGCSAGIAIYPNDGEDPEQLIKHAGIAMYRAKETGRNNFEFYTPGMNERAMERLRIERDLRNALDRDEFVLHYQPQVDLQSGRIVGVEALIRWQHPALGMVPPVRFIELAEETGLIVPIGAWVMRTACRQAVAWQRAGLETVRVAVNLSARQFYRQDLSESIGQILRETGLAPHLLELELTESMMMSDVEHAVDILRKLKAIGVYLSIDDFGTGYSSLAYLKRFPIDLLKIDRSFVRDITVDPDDAAIVTSIISLAHSLRLTVIAEGVETEAQLTHLRRYHCNFMQGYYFSPPVPADQCEQMLRQGKRLPAPGPDAAGPAQTLLIIDDDAEVLKALDHLLQQDGYQILTALTPDEAFEKLARHQVQVILCDQRMPKMTGVELLNRVKALYPDSMRIMLSGHAGLESVMDAVNRGEIYRFLTKPCDGNVLRGHLRDAFQQYWLRNAAAGRQAHAIGFGAFAGIEK